MDENDKIHDMLGQLILSVAIKCRADIEKNLKVLTEQGVSSERLEEARTTIGKATKMLYDMVESFAKAGMNQKERTV